MWQTLLTAIALVLVIEGLLPAIAPKAWRESLQQIMQFDDRTIRTVGLGSMIIGAGLLYLIN